jgi:hypothetical protein
MQCPQWSFPAGTYNACLVQQHCTLPCLLLIVTLAPNAGHQARLATGARHERTLAAVACMPLFGGPGTDCRLYCHPKNPCNHRKRHHSREDHA